MAQASLQHRLAKAIRAQREALGIGQEAFADKIEVHRTYYGAVELGKQNLTLRSLERIAGGLGVPVSRLFVAADREDGPEPVLLDRPSVDPVDK